MTAMVDEMPVIASKEVRIRDRRCSFIRPSDFLKEDLSRVVQQNYVLSSQYESLDGDDYYTKYKVRRDGRAEPANA